MPIKIDVKTNINDYDLTLEKCLQIITVLQDTYQNIRKEMYNHFLGVKKLIHALVTAMIVLVLYLITQDSLFLYLMPISVIIAMLTSILSAEYLISQTKKQIHIQLEHYINKRDHLLNEQKNQGLI